MDEDDLRSPESLSAYQARIKKLYGLECIQCGCCSYICPAKRPLTQTFMRTKAEIMARKRAEAGGKS